MEITHLYLSPKPVLVFAANLTWLLLVHNTPVCSPNTPADIVHNLAALLFSHVRVCVRVCERELTSLFSLTQLEVTSSPEGSADA